MKLSEIKCGEKVTVSFIDMNKTSVERLNKMGLTNGVQIIVIRRAPFNGPIEIKVRGFYVAIRRTLAEHINVRF